MREKSCTTEMSDILLLAKVAFHAQSSTLDKNRLELVNLIIEKMEPGSRPRNDLIDTVRSISEAELQTLIEEFRNKHTPVKPQARQETVDSDQAATVIDKHEDEDRLLRDTVVTTDGKIGSPLLQVYHGTISDFAEYKPGRGSRGQASDTKGAIFFTSSPEAAAYHTTVNKGVIRGENPSGANIRPAYLDIKEPYVVNAAGGYKDPNRVSGWIAEAKRLKFDGVIVKNVIDAEIGKAADVFIVFDNKQIVNSIQHRALSNQIASKGTENKEVQEPFIQNKSRRKIKN